jgi:nitrite reductase/ring-hydroxylating ferredoxin subunit
LQHRIPFLKEEGVTMSGPIPARDDPSKRVLVVSNDSEVFLTDGVSSAFDIFGGRLTEVKNLVARLDPVCDVSLGIISGRFGFVPANYVIMPYGDVPKCKADYQRLQDEKDYCGQLQYISRAFKKIVVCVPKDMFQIMIDNDTFRDGAVIAVACREHEAVCKEKGWTYLPRSGARVGNDNADRILEIASSL